MEDIKMRNFRKTLSLFMVIITVFILCGNIKSVKAAMPPKQYIVNDMGEAVLQIYQANDKDVVLPETVEIDGKTYPLTTIDENAFTWTSSVFSNIESIKILSEENSLLPHPCRKIQSGRCARWWNAEQMGQWNSRQRLIRI